MKKYKDLSVKAKLSIMMGVSSIVIMTFICLYVIIPYRASAVERSAATMRSSAMYFGNLLAAEINGVADVARTYSNVVLQIVESKTIPNEIKREVLIEQMEKMRKESGLDYLFCVFEPNGFDGLDSLYVNEPGSTDMGVFRPWFPNGMLETKDVQELEFIGQLKKTKHEIISEPITRTVNGNEVHLLSLSFPVVHNDQYIGAVGTEIFMDKLSRFIVAMESNTTGRLVTFRGNIAVSHYTEQIGKRAENINLDILARFKEEKAFGDWYKNKNGQEVYKTYIPVLLGEGNSPWFYAVDIPRAEVYAQAKNMTRKMTGACLLAVVLIVFSGWVMIRFALKDVSYIVGLIRKLSLGHINLKIDEHSNGDEIGQIKNELGKMINGLQHTAEFAKNIGEGRLDANYNILSNEDILGLSLLEMRQSLQKAENEQQFRTKEEERRNWGTAGLAKFAEILRNDNNNIEALSYSVISNMVRYLGANQGGIFILNENDNKDDRVLELMACYAFDRKKFGEKLIRPGEGLVGACFLEGEQIYMTDVPNDYINITSGLGDSNPKAVLICPLKVNEEIYGVLEIASFDKLEPYKIEFVHKVSESIAATISSVRVNIRTGKLLEQTQMQAEEMANAEEELRQSMEEMQSTQEEMRRREAELQEALEKMKVVQTSEEEFKDRVYWYESLLDACEDSPIFVTDMNRKITFMNRAGLNILGKTREDVLGRYCNNVWDVDICRDERCSIECLKRNSGSTVFSVGENVFSAISVYLKDRHGENIGYIEVITNITESVEREFEAKQLNNFIFGSLNIVKCSAEGIVIDVNEQVLKDLGITKKMSFVGKHISQHIGDLIFETVWENMKNGKPYENTQLVDTGIHGRVTEFRQQFIPVRNRNGKLLHVLLTVTQQGNQE